ncbi:hypothetical protein Terro_3160 [Terriglobus roseus DSM 18391]|uniref:Uncharacterized protein n=1 Tax=Terriglobus roseus (strain DSM 18391 / NRRL B-41598 / KBS 63) TaxID=926566 RepID=I3ZJG8_TERRK|nr:hypothetical protein [Terriglobus roseus]AFL89386.1 hypothetical protein Terro_3160 [Terriglobus roseus DSM 18391]
MSLRSPSENEPEWIELFTGDSDVAVIYWLTAARKLTCRNDALQKGWSRFAYAAEIECMRRGLPMPGIPEA